MLWANSGLKHVNFPVAPLHLAEISNSSTGFVPHIDQLFDEEVLIGKGWTTKESLRPLAYSTLADLVHHVRTHLPLPHLSLAVHMFSKNVHDDSLPVSIQTMSCKVSKICKAQIKCIILPGE